MLKTKFFSTLLFMSFAIPAAATQVPGGIYGNCHVQKGPAQQNLLAETVNWPFKTCPGSGNALPECEDGFLLVTKSSNSGNMDHSNYNNANKIFWVTYGCSKK